MTVSLCQVALHDQAGAVLYQGTAIEARHRPRAGGFLPQPRAPLVVKAWVVLVRFLPWRSTLASRF